MTRLLRYINDENVDLMQFIKPGFPTGRPYDNEAKCAIYETGGALQVKGKARTTSATA